MLVSCCLMPYYCNDVMCVRCGCVLRFKGVRLHVHICLCSGLDVTFEELRGWTKPSKCQNRVVTGGSSERNHLRCTSKPTSATSVSLLWPQAAEPLERPAAAAEPLERPASADGAAGNAGPMLQHARCSVDEREETVWNHPLAVQQL